MSELFSKTEREYGVNYHNHLFEQYKFYIESVEKTSYRRQCANNYFVTINTALISLIGLSLQINVFKNASSIKIVLSIFNADKLSNKCPRIGFPATLIMGFDVV